MEKKLININKSDTFLYKLYTYSNTYCDVLVTPTENKFFYKGAHSACP